MISNDSMKDLGIMLAGKYDPAKVRFPSYVQPKYDGIRCICWNGIPYSRTQKKIPNFHVQNWFQEHRDFLNLFDGELIVGDPTDKLCYRNTMSAIMSTNGEPKFTFYVFDILIKNMPFEQRMQQAHERFTMIERVRPEILDSLYAVPTTLCYGPEDVSKAEALFVSAGYEGAILRAAWGQYKFGRSTPRGGELIKLKRFQDAEAEIIGFEELTQNNNEPTLNASGHQVRSSHLANMLPKNTLGALKVKSPAGIEFDIGSGFTMAERQDIWDNKAKYLGALVTYKFVDVGGYDKPRFPIYKSIRHLGY